MSDHDHSEVRGVVVFTTTGDRTRFYQDPKSYAYGKTQLTPLGMSQSHALGSLLRSTYLNAKSPSHIRGMKTDLVDTDHVHVRAKAGGEGDAIFASSLALLQGLFPPTGQNREVLANETTVVAPLGGYQYVPIETIEPNQEGSLEPWLNCPSFVKHVAQVSASTAFKIHAFHAQPFFRAVKDFVFHTELNFENMYNVHDFISTQLIHNRTYAHRLPPTLIEQSRALVDIHQDAIWSSSDIGSSGNIAGRAALHDILGAVERIAYDHDPLQLLVQAVSYQPLISLIHMLGIAEEHPELRALPNAASALAVELRRGTHADARDFLRFKFLNGTSPVPAPGWAPPHELSVVHAFGHRGDVPLSEFVYRTEAHRIGGRAGWYAACNYERDAEVAGNGVLGNAEVEAAVVGGVVALLVLLVGVAVLRMIRRRRGGAVRLVEDEVARF